MTVPVSFMPDRIDTNDVSAGDGRGEGAEHGPLEVGADAVPGAGRAEVRSAGRRREAAAVSGGNLMQSIWMW